MDALDSRSQEPADSGGADPTPSSGAEGRGGRERADVELVGRALRGEGAALQEFLERMSCVRRFLTVQNARLGQPLGGHELEDVLQETLLALWQKLDQYRGIGSLEAWAFRFAYLRVLGRVRSLDYRPRLLDDLPEKILEPQAPAAPDAFRFEALYRGLERVSVEERRLVQRRIFEHRSFEDLEEEFSAPASTLKTRFYRTVARMRTWMGGVPGVRSGVRPAEPLGSSESVPTKGKGGE